MESAHKNTYSTPMLFIGLGTSGLKMLEETQRLFFSATGCSCPEHTRFLFVETDTNQKPDHAFGAPVGRPAMEVFRAPIVSGDTSIEQLRRKARVRVSAVDIPPSDSQMILQVRDGQPTVVPELNLPDDLYRCMAHIVSGSDRTLNPAAFEPLNHWFKDLGTRQGFLSLRWRKDLGTHLVDVFVPRAMPEKYQRRIEVLFNNVELTSGENGDIRWLPDPGKMAFAGGGAGGMRSFGRMALWSLSPEGSGLCLQSLRNKIRELYYELRVGFPSGGGMNEPSVYIAGTFTGGTCGGMFVDVAYLCRDVIDPSHQLNPSVMGLYLLPPTDSGDVKSVSNAYACLQDLDHFTRPDSQFLARWPLNVSVDTFPQGRTPFGLVTLMSLSWVPDGNLQSLYRMAGLFLFVMGSGFMSYRRARLVDIFDGGMHVWKFSAVGMSCLSDARGEVLTCAVGKYVREKMLQMWNDRKECRGMRAEGAIDRVFSERSRKYSQTVSEALKAAFEHLGNSGPARRPTGSYILDYLARVAKRIQPFDQSTLWDIWESNGELYRSAKAASPEAGAIVSKRLSALIIGELEDTECLAFANKVIERVCHNLDEVLQFWDKQKVDPWDCALGRVNDEDIDGGLISVLLSGGGLLLNEGANLRLSRMNEVLRKMHMSVLGPELRALVNYLRVGSDGNTGSRDAGPDPSDVPSMADIARLRATLADAEASVEKAQYQANERVRPNGLINYYHLHGSFADDVAAAFEGFCRTQALHSADTCSFSALALGDPDGRPWNGLWKQLSSYSHSSRDLADWLMERLSEQFERNNAPDSDSDKRIASNAELGNLAGTASTSMSLQLGVSTDFLTNASTHPKVIVASSPAAQSDIHRHLECYFNETNFVANQSACSSVGGMVVFFDERPVQRLEQLAGLHLWRPKYDERQAHDTSQDCYIHT